MKKNIKFIITNLILVLMLVILTSGMVFAADYWDAQLSVSRKSNNDIDSCILKVLKNGSVVGIENLDNFDFTLSDEFSTNNPIMFYIDDGTIIVNSENSTITYNSSNKSFKIVPNDNSDTVLGSNPQKIKVIVIDDESIVPIVEEIIAIPASPAINNAIFSVIPNLHSSSYILEVKNTTFNDIGKFSVYSGSNHMGDYNETGTRTSISTADYIAVGSTVTVKQSGNGNTVGTIKLPDIKGLQINPIVYEGVSDYFDIEFIATTRTGTKKMTISDLKALGWKDIDIRCI